ncbi:endonuclease/exonuclease/phosphatase family protein, partial [Trifolium medium]|nr:endonuclease/exonuclease/phosphatase family protein [Trifolium medium]
MIKVALKEWHLSHTVNLPGRIDFMKSKLSVLDGKREVEDLTENEVEELHEITSDLHSLSLLHASISWQQSISWWLKEGDANTKYFHSILA